MRVVVNQSMTLGPRTGIGHYTAELLRCLAAHRDVELSAFPEGLLRRLVRGGAQAKAALPGGTAAPSLKTRLKKQAVHWLRACSRTVLGQAFRWHAARQHFDVYHEPNFIPFASDLPTVTTVHDLSVLREPKWHPADRVAYFEKHFARSLAHSQHFLAISEFGRQELIRTFGIAPERVSRTYMGIRPGLARRPREQVQQKLRALGLPPQFLLYLGTIEPRKNVLTLLRAYVGLPAALRERWPLLLVGGMGWGAGPIADFLHTEGKQRGVLHLGYMAEECLPILYNGARALAYPSYYEGFGLPPVEMLACGGAVLASTAGAVAETVGGQAHLIEPDDVDGWRAALSRVVRDDDWWQSLRAGAEERARPYTWEECAVDTLAVYRKVCGVPAGHPLRKAG